MLYNFIIVGGGYEKVKIGLILLIIGAAVVFTSLVSPKKTWFANISEESRELKKNYKQTYEEAFPDDNLLEEVLKVLYFSEKEEFNAFDKISFKTRQVDKDLLDKITILDLSNKEINSAIGIEYFTNLEN